MARSKHGDNNFSNTHMHHTEHDQTQYLATRAQRAWFASGCTTLLICLAKIILMLAGSPNRSRALLRTTLSGLVGYILSDLGTGIYHWAVDNYGSPKTPIFGPTIESFRAHHEQPLAITKCEVASVLYILAGAVTITVMPITMVSNDHVVLGFVGVFAGCVMFSLQIHAWAHTSKRELSFVVRGLQDGGIILRPSQHAAHHKHPYNSSYCIVSGVWNRVLDRFKVYMALEVGLFRMAGVRPRSWTNGKQGRVKRMNFHG